MKVEARIWRQERRVVIDLIGLNVCNMNFSWRLA
jgi:hypothetical protein